MKPAICKTGPSSWPCGWRWRWSRSRDEVAVVFISFRRIVAVFSSMYNIQTGSGTVTYKAVRKAMNGEPFTMSLTDPDEIRAVIDAVNQGIDAHLEACYCPDRGDRYDGGNSERPGSWSFVTPWNARSAPNPCRSCFVVFPIWTKAGMTARQ